MLALQNIPDACPIVTPEPGGEFHLESSTLWNDNIYLQVNITERVDSLGYYATEDDFFADLVEHETVFLDEDFRNVVRYSLKDQIEFEFSYFGEPELDSEKIYRQIYNFHAWLVKESDSVIGACPGQNR